MFQGRGAQNSLWPIGFNQPKLGKIPGRATEEANNFIGGETNRILQNHLLFVKSAVATEAKQADRNDYVCLHPLV